ncbi:MAG: aminopeptidase P family protein [Clostridia bacterium]|jgi:Xaa-Pro aminopeptidase|nr:aminopeptidase P family protein [Clostridia bacterium]
MNTEKLASSLNDGEAYLIVSPENCFYFTGFPGGEGFLLLTKKERIYLTDSRYIEAARKTIKGCTDIIETDEPYDEIGRVCLFEGARKLFAEDGRITVSRFNKLREKLEGIEVEASPRLEDEINALRMKKSEEEIENILKAQAIAERAFDFILPFIKPGVSEIEIARKLDYFMLTNGAEAVSFDTIAVTGAKTSMPHGVPGCEKIKDGDFFLLDYGAVYNGYHSDMTRTVGVGNIGSKQAEVYSIVLEAQKKALSFLAPGKLCRDADAIARGHIKSKGYGEMFRHSTGHGVGVEIHEKPNLSSRNEKGTLEAGNVVTVEPGIYIPGGFGVRIEDMALITDTGSRNLTSCPKELITLQ